jgi:transposase
VPAVPSSIIEPVWHQFAALLPSREVAHPLGCHRVRIPDRIVFDKLVQVLVFGCAYHSRLRLRRDASAAGPTRVGKRDRPPGRPGADHGREALGRRAHHRLDQRVQEAGLVHRAPGDCRRVLDRLLGGDHHRRSACARGVDALPLGHPPITAALAYWRRL